MRFWRIAGTAVALAVLPGCTQSEKTEVRQRVEGFRQSAQDAAANAALEAKVKSALSTRKGLRASKIDVEGRGSTAVLKGDVTDSAQADLAESVALQTQGVERVENQLMIRVPASSVPRPE